MTKGDEVVSIEQSLETEDTVNGLPLQPKPLTPTQSVSQSQAKQISKDDEDIQIQNILIMIHSVYTTTMKQIKAGYYQMQHPVSAV